MLLPALSFLEGGFQSAPEVEDLHVAMLEDGLSAPIRRVLDAMDTALGGSGASEPVRASEPLLLPMHMTRPLGKLLSLAVGA